MLCRGCPEARQTPLEPSDSSPQAGWTGGLPDLPRSGWGIVEITQLMGRGNDSERTTVAMMIKAIMAMMRSWGTSAARMKLVAMLVV